MRILEIQAVQPLTTHGDPMENSNCGRTDFYSLGLILYSSIKIILYSSIKIILHLSIKITLVRAIGLKCKATGGPAPHLYSHVLTTPVPVNEEQVVPLQRVGGEDVCQPAGAVPYFVADPPDQFGLRACNYIVITRKINEKTMILYNRRTYNLSGNLQLGFWWLSAAFDGFRGW